MDWLPPPAPPIPCRACLSVEAEPAKEGVPACSLCKGGLASSPLGKKIMADLAMHISRAQASGMHPGGVQIAWDVFYRKLGESTSVPRPIQEQTEKKRLKIREEITPSLPPTNPAPSPVLEHNPKTAAIDIFKAIEEGRHEDVKPAISALVFDSVNVVRNTRSDDVSVLCKGDPTRVSVIMSPRSRQFTICADGCVIAYKSKNGMRCLLVRVRDSFPEFMCFYAEVIDNVRKAVQGGFLPSQVQAIKMSATSEEEDLAYPLRRFRFLTTIPYIQLLWGTSPSGRQRARDLLTRIMASGNANEHNVKNLNMYANDLCYM
jgi:hypothetical protein